MKHHILTKIQKPPYIPQGVIRIKTNCCFFILANCCRYFYRLCWQYP